jgi:hypothetical protein
MDSFNLTTYWVGWLDPVDDRLKENWRVARILNM